MSTIRIAIADDHPMVITGLRDMLSGCAEITVEDTYLNASELMKGLMVRQPQVLLLDIRMPDHSAEEIVPILLKTYPGMYILIITNFDNMLYVHTMMNAGVHGYLMKNTDRPTLIKAIITIFEGGVFLKPELQERLELFRCSIKKSSSSKFSLTPREKDILKLIAQGESNQEVSKQLFLSLRTVENYRLNLSLKLEVKNTAGLVRKALELGIIL